MPVKTVFKIAGAVVLVSVALNVTTNLIFGVTNYFGTKRR